MNDLKFLFSLFVFIVIIISCNNSSNNQEESKFTSVCYNDYKTKEIFHTEGDLQDIKLKGGSLNRTKLIGMYLENPTRKIVEEIIDCYDYYYSRKYPDKKISLSLTFFNKKLTEKQMGDYFGGEGDEYEKYVVGSFFHNYSNDENTKIIKIK